MSSIPVTTNQSGVPSALAWPLCFVLAVVAAIAAALLWNGPIAQPADYHRFADTRTWLGIPHAADVLSNLPFWLAGWLGLRAALRLPLQHPARAAWGMFFSAVMLTTVGSAFYHWSPDNFGLAIDRLPIAWACAWLTLALLAERVVGGLGRPVVIFAAWLVATAAVWLWYTGEMSGSGDLRAYLFVQFLPVLLIPFVCAMFRGGLLHATDWYGAIALYLVAKALELHDVQVFETLGAVSGHTLKHLVAASAAFWLAWRLRHAANSMR